MSTDLNARESYGQLQFINNAIESDTGDIDIEIGLTGSAANLKLNRNVILAKGKTLGLVDHFLGTVATLSVITGSLIVSGARQFQVGNIQLYDDTIESAAPTIDLQLGAVAATANLVINRNTVHYPGKTVTFRGTTTITGSLLITGSGFINSKPILTSATTSSFENGFGWYGAFCSTGSQTNPVANVSRSMQLDTVDHSVGITVVNGSRITFANGGVYNIQFSAQFEKTSAGVDAVNIWFKKNGTNVPRSNGVVDISKTAGGRLVAAWNYVDTFNSGDYFEIVFQSADTTIQISAFAATGNIPLTPSVIITATQVG